MFKLAPEGFPFIAGCALITLFILFFIPWLAVFPLFLTSFMVFFFRDPERETRRDRNMFFAPADGRVISVKEAEENELLNKRALEISIFMSPIDVHVNRSPCDGSVVEVKHYPGRFSPAFKEGSSLMNEHITMLLDTEYGEIVMRQVAGFLARRAVCRVKSGDSLKQGQRYGIIKFSSRVDVFLPLNTRVKVKLHDKVKAGETVIAVIEDNK